MQIHYKSILRIYPISGCSTIGPWYMKILNIAVIGASGGIGSALIKTLSKSKPNRVFAFSRSIIDEKLDDVVYEHIDISCEASIERAVRTVQAHFTTNLGCQKSQFIN